MKRTIHMLIVFAIISTAFSSLMDGVSCAESILVFSRQAKRIIRENFDELYPGVPEAEKRNILIIPWSNFINNKSVFDVELSYKGEEGMSVYVTIDRTTGKIIDKTPWDFAALINDYTSSISRDELDRIVIPLYKGALEEAKNSYPDKAKSFIDEYGADSLDLENMFFEYLFISPHDPGSADEPPHWQVFVVHKLDVNPLTNSNYGNGWFFAEIDGKTGEILESEIKYDVFSVDTRLR